MTVFRRWSTWAACVALAPLLLPAQAPIARARIDSVFARYNRTNGPGCAVGVYRNGEVAFAQGYGMADLNQGIAISPRTVFYIASTSKQFAAASLQLLVAQGKVSLGDPLQKYIPEMPAYATGVTLAHVLHHLSGIRDYLGLWGLSGRSGSDEIPEEAALELITRQQALDFAPGSRWSYSNSNYFLISLIVKRVSGMSLRAFAQAHIFGPLGMTQTHFHDDKSEVVPHRAEGYEPDGKGGYRVVRTSFALVGDGGLYTTVEDLARWDETFFNNRLSGGGPAFIQRLTTPGVLNTGDATDYASGLFIRPYRGQPTISHGGSFIGYRAELLRFPAQHTSVAVLCNDYTAASEAMATQVADVVLGPVLSDAGAGAEAPARRVAAAVLQRYRGRYEVLPGVAAVIIPVGDTLSASVLGMTVPMTPVDDSTFTTAALPGTFAFRRLTDGGYGLQAAGLGMTAPGAALGEVPVLSAEDRGGIVGRYQSDELLATFAVRDTNGVLEVRGGWGTWMPMAPFARGAFSVANGKLTVERDRSGRVTGMRLDAGRMQGITLVRLASSR